MLIQAVCGVLQVPHYSSLSKNYTVDDKEFDINPLSLSVDYAVMGNCKSLFSISKEDVEKKEKAINLTYYAMSSTVV